MNQNPILSGRYSECYNRFNLVSHPRSEEQVDTSGSRVKNLSLNNNILRHQLGIPSGFSLQEGMHLNDKKQTNLVNTLPAENTYRPQGPKTQYQGYNIRNTRNSYPAGINRETISEEGPLRKRQKPFTSINPGLTKTQI